MRHFEKRKMEKKLIENKLANFYKENQDSKNYQVKTQENKKQEELPMIKKKRFNESGLVNKLLSNSSKRLKLKQIKRREFKNTVGLMKNGTDINPLASPSRLKLNPEYVKQQESPELKSRGDSLRSNLINSINLMNDDEMKVMMNAIENVK